MKILLVPDPTSPNGEDAFCREISKRAPARGHSCAMRAASSGPGPVESDVVVVNSLQAGALRAASMPQAATMSFMYALGTSTRAAAVAKRLTSASAASGAPT